MKNLKFSQVASFVSVISLYFYFIIFDVFSNSTLKWMRDFAFFALVSLELIVLLFERQKEEIKRKLSDFIVPASTISAFILFQIRNFLDLPTRAGVSKEASSIPKIRDFLLVIIVLLTIVSLVYMILLFISRQSEKVQSQIGNDKRTLLQNTLLNFLYIAPIVIAINYITVQRNYSFDLSSIGKFSYSDTSRKLLKDINKEILVTAFFSCLFEAYGKQELWVLSALRPDIEIYLQKLSAINSNIKIKFINADVETDLLADFPGVSNGTISIRSLKNTTRIDGNPYLEEKVIVQSKKDLEDLERKLVQAINNVNIPQRKVYITVQNGERFGQNYKENINEQTSKLVTALNFFNFSIKGLTYQEGWPKIPSDADLVLILGPTVPFSEEVKSSIMEYIEKRQGKLIITIDPNGGEDFSWLLSKTKLEFKKANLRQIDGRVEVVANNLPDHPIHSTVVKKELGVVFPYSGYFDIKKTREDLVFDDEKILESGFNTFIDKNKNEKRDSEEENTNFLLGSILTLKKESNTEVKEDNIPSRILIFSGTAWATDKYFLYNLNPTFFTNSINWMFMSAIIGSILPKKEEVPTITLTPNQKVFIWSVGMFGFPGFLIIGLSYYVIYRKRKRLS
ncbi:MAG: Gldg family protein [Leptospiraceae bacterium]|nr:Gldg family protein [Leptospiraceae bacterium]